MSIVSKLEPQSVFTFFEEICQIPHGSGNMEQISNFLKEFALKRNLEVIQDDFKNIIIIKEATKGYEEVEPVIIQGHMDMVTVKKPDCNIDFLKDGLHLNVEGDYLYAEGTSLGGDDGIAVAYSLALLDAQDISHPRLEVVITVDEEIGLLGATSIDLSMLKGKRLMNLDSEDEGIILTSCAGGARVKCSIPISCAHKKGIRYELIIDGLQGGHSGVEIHKERGNSNTIMGRMLDRIMKDVNVSVSTLQGGVADNVIAKSTKATIIVNSDECEKLEIIVEEFHKIMKQELASRDSNISIKFVKLEEKEEQVITRDSLKKVIVALFNMPEGIQSMSAEIHGLVQTSLNLGVLTMNKNEVILDYSVRSSVKSEKEKLVAKMESLASLLGAEIQVSGDYPAWEYKKDSKFRELLIEVYKEMYHKEPVIEAIHAGLECGILSVKIPGLDCVSLGPDMLDIHSTEEKLCITSVQRVWEYLLEVLKRK